MNFFHQTSVNAPHLQFQNLLILRTGILHDLPVLFALFGKRVDRRYQDIGLFTHLFCGKLFQGCFASLFFGGLLRSSRQTAGDNSQANHQQDDRHDLREAACIHSGDSFG